MEYTVTFTPTFYNHEFKRYNDLVRYHRSHPEDCVLSEYERLTKTGCQDYLYGDPHLRTNKKNPFCSTSEDYKKYARAKKFATCMDIAHDKGCAVTKYATIPVSSNVDFARYPQGFDPDVELANISLFNIWRACAEYRQVSAGISHLYRNIIIVDIDNKDNSVTTPSIHKTIQDSGLPCPNYIITHHKSSGDTFQLGFLMENPLRVKDAEGIDTITTHGKNTVNHSKYYISLVHKMNEVLPGDAHYSGWQVKNPFFCQNSDEFSVQWFTEEAVSSWYDLRTILGVPLTICNLNISSALSSSITSPLKKPSAVGSNPQSSRNYHLRQFIAAQVRSTKASISESEMLSLCLSNKELFARRANKPLPQSDSEITRVVHSSYNYFIKTYNNAEGTRSDNKPNYSSISRQCSQLKRGLSRFYKQLSVFNLESLGFTRSDICSNLSINPAHFSRYHLTEGALKSELSALLAGFKDTLHFFGVSNSTRSYWLQAIQDLSALVSEFTPATVSVFLSSRAA